MKIAYLSHLDINLYLFRLSWMKALIKEGHEVYVIVPRGVYFEKFREHGIKPVEYVINRGGLNPFSALITIYKVYKILRTEKFDILHTFTIKPNIYGAFAGKLAGTPNIYNHVTGLGYLFTERNLKVRILRFFASLIYRLSFKIARKVIFQNSNDLEDFKSLLPPEKSTIIKGTGVDLNYFSSDGVDPVKINKIKKELFIESDAVVITLIARLLWNKGIREFIEAANSLTEKYSHLIFLVVGWIDTGNPSAITKEFIEKAEISPKIHFLGEREDIREILAVTDIYALPSYREGTPRTVLEAMAMGKPIITTDVPGCKQTVENGVNGFLVAVRDSSSIVYALERLVFNKELRETMGKAGREKVVQEFSDEIVIKQIFQIYQSAAI